MDKSRPQVSWDIEGGLGPHFQLSRNLKAQVLEYLAKYPKDVVYHLRKLLQNLEEGLKPLKGELADVGEFEKLIGETERKLRYSSGEDIVKDFIKELRDVIRRLDWTPSGSKDVYAAWYDLVNDLKDERRQNAELLQQKADSQKQIADLQKQIADLLSPNAALPPPISTFRDQVILRQLLQNFKHSRHDLDRQLMLWAQKSFSFEFPKESQDLRKSVKEKFPYMSWESYVEIWNLMKLVRDLSLEKAFGYLTSMVRKDLPQGFSVEQLRVAVENRRGSSKDAALLGVHKWICDRFPEEPIQKKCVDLIISARKIFPTDDLLEKFKDLISEAERQFPTEYFPEEFVSRTFTGTVSVLVYRKSGVKDKEVLQAIDRKFRCLLDVAKTFNWQAYFKNGSHEDFGKEFFNLCVCCAQWNIDVFHPKISGTSEKLIYSLRAKGRTLKAENEDVGLVVEEFLHLPEC